MRHTIILAATLTALLALTAPARADMVDDCEQTRDSDLRIGGCTAVIRSGQYSGEDLAVAYSNRGVAYYDLGDYTRAIENYDQAMRLDPGHVAAYNNRGNANSKLGDPARAIADYDQALRLNPRHANAYSNRGVSYKNSGDPARAIEDYNQALRIDPGHVNAYQNRGVSYESPGYFERAAEDWEQAIRFGGAARAEWWQKFLKRHGHYAGTIDGIFGPGTRRGLLTCAIDPAC